MTPSEIADLRDAEDRLELANNELTILLNDEQATAAELKEVVYLVRLIQATIDALLRPSHDLLAPAASNVIPFPMHRRLH